MAREASPPERDRLTPNKETTMFRGKGGEPLSRPKVHTKVTPTARLIRCRHDNWVIDSTTHRGSTPTMPVYVVSHIIAKVKLIRVQSRVQKKCRYILCSRTAASKWSIGLARMRDSTREKV